MAKKAAKAYVPDRGDLVWIDPDPVRSHEQGRHRPALVLTPKGYNAKSRLMIACFCTARIKGRPFEVALPDGETAVLADQVRTLAWAERDARFHEKAPPQVLETVLMLLDELFRGADQRPAR